MTLTALGETQKISVANPEISRKLASEGGQFIADYGGWQAWSVPSSLAESLADQPGVTLSQGEDVIELLAGPIRTSSSATPTAAKGAKVAAGKQLRLVQFAGPIKPEWHAALQAQGLRVVSYIPHNAYLVYGDASVATKLRGFAQTTPQVQWEGAYLAEHKIHPRAAEAAAKALRKEPTEDLFAVQLVEDETTNPHSLQFLNGIRRELVRKTSLLGYLNLVLRLPPERLQEVAALPDVVSIQVYRRPQKNDERQGQILAGNLTAGLPNGPGYLAWLATKGFTPEQFAASGFAVDVSDSGIDNGTASPNHPNLHILGNAAQPSRVIYNRLVGTPNTGSTIQGCDGHGNLNSHIIAGYNALSGFPHTDSVGYHYGLGIAPFVRVGSSVVFDPNTFTDPNFAELQSRAYQDGSRINCNSWGASVGGAYTIDCQAYDALVRDAQPAGSPFATPGNQEMVIVFSAGNSGSTANTIGAPGSAKNVICVGASENVHSHSSSNGGADSSGNDGCNITDIQANSADDIINFSSRGPCDDGRIKPDIMGPGTHVTGGVAQQPSPGANGTALACFAASGVCALPGGGTVGSSYNFFPTGQQFYTTSSGTSHSCPAVGGGAALLRQYFINHNWTAPSPAMTKAWLMNSARYMTGLYAGDTLPSNNQGMGMMNLGTGFDDVPRMHRDELEEDRFTATGQSRTFEGVIYDSSRPLRVTLAWTDAPGSTSGNSYNNDLDLTVTIGGQTYRGNVFSGGLSVAGGTKDFRNNVESIFLPAGYSGSFTVTVTAANINSDGVPGNSDLLDQDFALVVYNNSEYMVDLRPAGATITSESCSPNQGVIDPGETVTVQLALQNFGPSNTTSLVATLLPTNGVLAPSTPQNYGVLARADGAVSRPFTFTAAGTCGSTIAAVLQLQDGTNDYGIVQFPFPLGQVATNVSAQTNTSTVTITATDGTVSQYPSAINVTGQSGAINHLAVTLRGLSHTWPQDLDILLAGPQGQSVLLLSDTGGSIDVTNLLLTFDDAASANLPLAGPLTSGSWRPTTSGTNTPLPSPAPQGPHGTALTTFNGTNPNGIWQLFIRDKYPSDDGGTLSDGWSLTMTTTNSTCCADPSSVDLALKVQAVPSPVLLSNKITFLLTVTNNGPAAATNVMLTNLLSPAALFMSGTPSHGTLTNSGNTIFWDIGTLAPGAGASAQIIASVAGGPIVQSSAQVSSGQTDLNPLDNQFVLQVNVIVPSLSVQDVSIIEGDEGTRPAVFVVTLSEPAPLPVDVDYMTVEGSATAGLDFLAQSNHLHFNSGETYQTVAVPVLGDVLNENDETFRLVLFNPVNAALGRGEASCTILDDDPMPSVSIGDVAVVEGQSGTTNALFPLTLSAPSGRWVSVLCSTTNGTALGGSDFTNVFNQKATFAPGQTVTNFNVQVIGDTEVEPDETFFVQLSSPTNAVLGRSVGTGTILTDDLAPLVSLVSYRLTAESQLPANGTIDFGETVTLSVAFHNTGPVSTTNLVITLLPGGGVGGPSGPQTYGQLLSGGPPVSRPFTFTNGVANCSTLRALFQLQDGTVNLGTQTLSIVIGNCFADNFEPDIHLDLWSSFGGTLGSTVLATNYGGSISGTHSLWFGDNGSRYAATRPIDAMGGGTVQFYLHLANGSAAPWETVDLPYEGIVLEYSVDSGSTWVEFGRYDTSVYYNWTFVTADIPFAAQTSSTEFRWRQLTHSGSCCDHWAIDDVMILAGPRPPTLLTQPLNQTVRPGSTVSFCVTAQGSLPLTYQWQKNGTNLVDGGRIYGATNSCLQISGSIIDDSGAYTVTVVNWYGMTTSNPAMLLVSPLDHFAWSLISSPQIRTVPFAATLTAQDNLNATVTNFNGCVSFSSGIPTTNMVGTGTVTTVFPIGTGYHDERTQVIYQSAELPGAGRITGLALDVSSLPGQLMNNWTIRLKHTTLSGYTSYLWEGSGWTTVYQTNLSVTRTGWLSFNFTTPFDYNGSNNLMVDFSFNNSSYTTDGICRSTTRSGVRTLFYRTDSGYGDPLSWSGSSPSPGTSTYTPNLRLVFGGGAPIQVTPSVACLTNGLWTGSVIVQSKGTNLALLASDASGHTGLSNPFDVVSTNDPPVIVTQPKDKFVLAGGSALFSAAASGTPPLAYQWTFFSTNLPGQTSSTLSLTGITTNQAGHYAVVVTNNFGSDTSAVANLSVLPGPIGTVAIYGAEANPSYLNDVSNKLSSSLFFTGVDTRRVFYGYVVPTLAELLQYPAVLVFSDTSFGDPVALGNVLADYVDAGGGVVLATYSFSSSIGIRGRLQTDGYLPLSQSSTTTSGYYLTMAPDLPGHLILNGVNSFNGGGYSYHHASITTNAGSSLVAHWSDGLPLIAVKQPSFGRVVGLNFFPPSDSVVSGFWSSSTDGALLMANALVWASQANSLTNPFVVVQPAGRSALPGTNVTLCVTAGGSRPLNYQWMKNGTNLVDGGRFGGALTRCLTISNVVEADTGDYTVAIWNSYATTNSLPATLLVSSLDHFAWSPIASPQVRDLPFMATLTAQDATNGMVTNFNRCVSLVLPSVTNTMATGAVTTVFPMGTSYNDERTQVIYPSSELPGAGRITGLALDVATVPGLLMNNWTIRIKHTPLNAYSTYLWESSGWTTVYQTNLSVAKTGWDTFNFTTPFDYNGVDNLMVDFSFHNNGYSVDGYCRCMPRSGVQTLYFRTSSSYGDPLSWSGSSPYPYTSSYTPNLRLVFSRGDLIPLGPVTACFTNGFWTGPITIGAKATNLVLVADDLLGQSGLSNPFNVAGTNDPPVFTAQPTNQILLAGGTAVLSATAYGTPPLAYQWRFHGTNLPGETSASLNLSGIVTNQAGPYLLVVTNTYGSVTSSVATLTILPGPIGQVAIYGAEATFDYNNDISNKLSRSIFFTGVDSRLLTSGFAVPTLAELLQYPAVLLYSDYSYNDPVALGNVLADYVDAGGGVVLATFSFTTGTMGVGGRFLTGGYLPLTQSSSTSGSYLSLVPDLPAHPILAGVNSFNGGGSSYHNYPITTNNSATLVAHWSDAQPLVATLEPTVGRVVGLNFFPPSDTIGSGFWSSSTDGARLMANALLWASQSSSLTNLTIVTQPTSRGVLPGTNVGFCVTVAGARPLNYQWMRNGTNLVDGGRISGAHTRCLAIANVIEGDSGDYVVTIANGYGTTNSQPATLLVSVVDHFAWNPIASPQLRDAPFLATLTAQDGTNGTVTNFDRCVSLSADTSTHQNIGTSGDTVYFPMSTGNNDARSQVIYQAAEVGRAGCISAIALNAATAPGQTISNWTIRLKHTPSGAYTNYQWESTGWTTVYQTNLSVIQTGWVTFSLTTPFVYNGVDNLMVDFSFHNSSANSVGYCYGTARSEVRTLYYYTSSNYGDPLAWSGNTPNPYSTTYIPNLRLVLNTGCTPVPMQPLTACLTNGVWSGSVAVQAKATNVALVADDALGHTGRSAPLNIAGTNDAPTITGQPTDQLGFVGGAVLFSANVYGTPPLAYQWTFFNTNLIGQTGPTLNLGGLALTQAGPYSVVITNAFGATTSSVATLTVLPGPLGRVAIYGAESSYANNVDISNKLSGSVYFTGIDTRLVSSGYAVPTLAELLQYPAVLVYSDYAFADPIAFGNALADYVDAGGGVVLAAFSHSTSIGIAGRISTGGYLPLTLGSSSMTGYYLSLVPDLPAHPILRGVNSFDGGMYSYQNYPVNTNIGATLVAHWSGGQPLVATKPSAYGRVVALNFYPPSDVVGTGYWDSTTDGGQLMANALLWASQGSPPTVPLILGQPTSRTVATGADVSFNVAAVGVKPLAYQWYKAGSPLATATNSSFGIIGAQTNDSGNYYVIVTNTYGSATSTVATLNVIDLPPSADFQIIALLTNNSRVIDHDAITGDDRGGIAASTSTLVYSGDNSSARFALSDLSGGTALGRIFDALVGDLHSGTIYSLANGTILLTSAGGTVTTLLQHDDVTGLLNGSSITLSSAISLPANSGNVGIFAGYGQVVLFSGSQAYSIDLPSGLVTYLGAMSIPNHSYSENWAYWGVAEHWAGQTYVVYVRDSQTIVRTRVPDGLTTVVNTFISLSDMASFTVCPTLGRWYFHHEGSSQFGGTSETIGYADAVLNIQPPCTNCPPAILSQPLAQTVAPGGSVNFSVSATGTFPLSYQWRFNGTNILNATNVQFTVTGVGSAQAGNYSVKVTNVFGFAISSNALLTVTATPGATVLAQGNLYVVLTNPAARIHSFRFRGDELYRVGTYMSDWGLQLGTSSNSFVRNENNSGGTGQPMTLASSGPTSATFSGRYTAGGANVALTRQYALMPGADVLRTIQIFRNDGASSIALRCFDTFDPDLIQGGNTYYNMNADRYTLTSNGCPVLVGSGTILATSNVVVLLGTADSQALIAASSTNYFGITTSAELNSFFATGGADSEGLSVDKSLDIGRELTLAPGTSASFVFYQSVAGTVARAQSALLNSVVNGNPSVQFLPPNVVGSQLQLVLATVDGTPLTPERAAQLYIYVSTDLRLPFSSWTLLRTPVVLTNGCLRIDGLNTTNSKRQFFRAFEGAGNTNPAVLLLPPQRTGSNLELWLTTVDNSPLTVDRVARIQILSSTNLSLPFNSWTPESNSLVLVNGCARMSGLSTTNSPRRFFRLLSAP